MQLIFRETQPEDIESLFRVRARTRENAISEKSLASLGITAESIRANLESGKVSGWVCLHESEVIGFCNGDTETGEVLVLAVLPDYEGKRIGRRLLLNVVERLRSLGRRKIWLYASSDSRIRAHGFYRSLGWRPTGERLENGDEVLLLEALP
jgi:ribosomal protein S18 acetylase RimI-like enzyme